MTHCAVMLSVKPFVRRGYEAQARGTFKTMPQTIGVALRLQRTDGRKLKELKAHHLAVVT